MDDLLRLTFPSLSVLHVALDIGYVPLGGSLYITGLGRNKPL